MKSILGNYALYEMKHDDERFGLKAGDIFIGEPYQYDHGKTSVAFRVSDGFRPSCNQYNESIRRLSALETEKVIWHGQL